MPSVWLSDDEVVDPILERPYLIQAAIEKIRKEFDETEESYCNLINSIGSYRRKIKELEEKLAKDG